MKIENRIMLNSVYGNPSLIDLDTKDVLMNNMEKAFRAFSRKNKINRILSKKAAN
jgi:hypothetical protein